MARPAAPDDELGTRWDYSDPAEPFRVTEERFRSGRGTDLYGKHLLSQKDGDRRIHRQGSILCLFGAGDHCNSPYHGGQMITLARMGFDVHSFDYESLVSTPGQRARFMHRLTAC